MSVKTAPASCCRKPLRSKGVHWIRVKNLPTSSGRRSVKKTQQFCKILFTFIYPQCNSTLMCRNYVFKCFDSNSWLSLLTIQCKSLCVQLDTVELCSILMVLLVSPMRMWMALQSAFASWYNSIKIHITTTITTSLHYTCLKKMKWTTGYAW